MQQIIPGLHTFTGLMAGRAYAIEDADGLTLIDTSIASAPRVMTLATGRPFNSNISTSRGQWRNGRYS